MKLVKITKKSYHPNIPEEILPRIGEVYELNGIRYLLVDSYRPIEDILAEEKCLGYKLVFLNRE